MQHEPQIGSVAELASRARLSRNPQGLAPITFLIGAGCSVSAGVPAVITIGKDEVVRLAHKLTGKMQNDPAKALIVVADNGYLKGHQEIARNSPDQLEWGAIYDTLFAEVHTSPSEVSRLFKSIIKDARPKINWAHLALGELARLNWISTTITTNFDLLALEGHARAGVIPVVSDGLESLDRIDPNPDQPQLLQINGSVHSYRLRNSQADLELLKANPSAITRFRNLFQASDLLIVVGYEGREPQIMHLLTEAAKTFPDKHIFWCLYSSNPANLSPRAAEFLSHSRNARLIPGQDADLFFHTLLTELRIGAPQALHDPLTFLELRLNGVYAADRPEHAPILAHITGLRDRITRLRSFENSTPAFSTPKKLVRPHGRKGLVKANAVVAHLQKIHPDDPAALFEALGKAFNEWLEPGRDKGLTREIEIAIDIARAQLELARSADQRGVALNNLGISLKTLGSWEADNQRLEEAVAAYRAALEEHTRDSVPLNWAMTQNNLGNALQEQGARDGDPQRLEAAVAAFRFALEEFTRERLPLDWAMTQNNLGTALAALGQPTSDPQLMQQAVAAFRTALEEYTEDRVPLDWAMTQMNLGNALMSLGKRENEIVRMEEAVTAYRAALEQWTRDRVPLDWAITMGNMAAAEISFYDKTGDPRRLATAREHAIAAREVFVDVGAAK